MIASKLKYNFQCFLLAFLTVLFANLYLLSAHAETEKILHIPCSGMDEQYEVAYFLYEEINNEKWEGTHAAQRVLDLGNFCNVTHVKIIGHASKEYDETHSFETTLHFMNRAYHDVLATKVATGAISMSYAGITQHLKQVPVSKMPLPAKYGRIEIIAYLEGVYPDNDR